MIDILSPEFAANPYPFYKEMRDKYPLYLHSLTNSYILSRYEDVEKGFKDPVFSTANYIWQLEPVHGKTILQMDGREHSTHRNLLTPAFRGRDLQEKFVPVIERNADELIESMGGQTQVDFVKQFATLFPISVIVDMLGLPRADIPKFHGWYTSIMAFLSNLSQDPDVTAHGIKTKTEFEEYMLPVIAARRQKPGDDLLSTMCNAEIDGVRMSDHEIKAFCSLLLTAGGETTDKALASLLLNLMRNPEQMAMVRKDRSLIDKAFAETLRYTPPVHMIMRQTTEDITVSGGVIPKDSTVTCLIGAANHDERQFKNPDVFNIMRDDLDTSKAYSGAANHTAFGLGRHFCVGSMLAKMEVTIAMNKVLDHMDNIKLNATEYPKEEGIFTRAVKTLPIVFKPSVEAEA